MKTNYRLLDSCLSCKFCHVRRDGEITRLFCNKDGFIDRFNFNWWKNGYLTSAETNDLFLEEETHRIYCAGICDEWEKVEELYD